MYELMTQSYHESNKYRNRMNEGIIFHYSILDKTFNVIREGKCKNVIYRYDPCYDYNIISFTDIDTGEGFSRCQFYVRLNQVE